MSQTLVLYMASLALRSIGVAVIAGLCNRKMRNVAMRHAVWVAVLGAMFLMPVLDYLLPAAWVPSRIQKIPVEQAATSRFVVLPAASVPASQHPLTSTASPPLIPATSPDWWKRAAALYALVSFAMFMALLAAYRKTWKLRRTATPISSELWDEVVSSQRVTWRTPTLLESKTVQVPLTIGLLKPVVLLPAGWQSWDQPKLRAVLSHEYAHVRRGDWAIAATAAVAKCAYWMNPLAWFLERKLSQLAEQASDDAAVGSTRNTTRYAEILLEFAAVAANGGRYLKGGVAMTRHSTRARIERVLSNEQSGTGILNLAGWMLVLLLAAPVLYSAAALQVSERAPIPASQIKPPTASQQPRILASAVSPGAPVPSPVIPTQPAPQQLQPRPQPAPGGLAAQNQLAQSDSANAGAYVIRPSDVLSIFVWKEPQVSSKVTVQPDGLISIPLVQDVSAAGSTPAQLKAEIEKRLRPYIDQPIVTVMLESISSYRVSVMGQVQKQGSVTSEKPLTVLEALALSGGFGAYAKRDEISIVRNNESVPTVFRFSYSNVVSGRDLLSNITLKSGDVVVVP